MGVFSFHCPTCRKHLGALTKTSDGFVCSHCHNKRVRTTEIIPDDFGRDIVCTPLKGVDGNMRKSPVVRTRTELNRVLRRHNEIYGTSLEPIGKRDIRPMDAGYD